MKRKGHLAVFENILEENESNSEYDPNDCEDEKKVSRISDYSCIEVL